MEKFIIVIAAMLLLPKLSGSAEYIHHVSAESVIENRGGQVSVVVRSPLSKRLERFIRKYRQNDAAVMAEFIAACKYPRLLAAIAAKESGFDETAVGAAGEIGMLQVIPEIHGHPGKSWQEQVQSTERILEELVSGTGGRVRPAVRSYNGSGPRAERYATHVLAMAQSI